MAEWSICKPKVPCSNTAHDNFFLTIKVLDIFCKICKQYFCMICGDFPVNSKLITYKAYMVFVMQYLLVYQSENLWGFQVTCNTCNNYVLIAGYPALHGVLLYFLRGKHLQCMYIWFPWSDGWHLIKTFQFWQKIWIQVVFILLQL